MNKLTTVVSSIALAALGATVGAFSFASCTNPSSPATTVGAPTNLMALSKDANTISIKWTRGANDTAAETVAVAANGTTISTLQEPASVTSLDLTTLNTGTVYTITVTSSGGSTSINWMTANRTPSLGAAPLRIYQYSGTGASALILNGAAGTAQVVSLKNNPTAPTTVDFIFDDTADVNSLDNNGVSLINSPTGMTFETAQAYDNTWKHLWVNTDAHYVVGGLDSDWSATDYSSAVDAITAITDETKRGDEFPIPSDNGYTAKGARVLLVLTSDGHFAKVAILPQSDGRIYGGTWPNQYIDVNVSYQTAANENYAARPHSRINYGPGRAPQVPVQ
jgi:hypothetical protein